MAEQLFKLSPDRDLQCYFERPSAVAALSEASPNGFTVSGAFRQQLDWAVVEWNRDNVFEHPSLRCLPDGDLSGLRLSYEEERENCVALDCSLWPTVDWPYLRIWATGADGVERVYKVPLANHATPVAGEYAAAQAEFDLTGAVTGGDYVELIWEAGDGVSPWVRHATHMMYGGRGLADAASAIAAAIAAGSDATGMTATADGNRITMRYSSQAGANGNRVGVYGNVTGAATEIWSPAWQIMSGGASPAKWRIDLDFSALQGLVGPEFTTLAVVPTDAVRRMRWTWAPRQSRDEFTRTEFSVRVSNWSVSGSNRAYYVAGPGSRRVEDDSDALCYAGAWNECARGNYSGGSIRLCEDAGASVSYSYEAEAPHALYLGTRKYNNGATAGALIRIMTDGQSREESLALGGVEDVLVRIKAADLGPGAHTISVAHGGSGGFYFDFFEICRPTAVAPELADVSDTTLATDWDTDHSLALAPERSAWLMNALGFAGRANHYAGALWFYELVRPGHQYASATVTFNGAPDFGGYTNLRVSDALFQHLNLIGDTDYSIAKAFELELNAGATAVRASAQGNTLTIWARAMGTAGNGMAVAADTGGSLGFAAEVSGNLAGGSDGDVEAIPWAQGWRTDLAASPRMNRAARDWHRSYFRALKGYGIEATAAFSMELQHGDPQPASGIAQRYPDGSAALLTTPALQTNFSPASLAFWKQAYLDMAGVMSEAGIRPFLQFGEVQWWYFASSSGMPFYDAYSTSSFLASHGRALPVITSQFADPAGLAEECSFLAGQIGAFTDAVSAGVLAVHPDAKFEALYAPDVNDTPLNQAVNFPVGSWTPAKLACLKTENFTYTGNRDLDKARGSMELAGQRGFPPSQRSHLVGISDYTTPWQRERRLALGVGMESVVLFALDQFCLIGYPLPLSRGLRRSSLMGV
jgi:hypothetical protein